MQIRWLHRANLARDGQLDYIANENPAAAYRLDREIDQQVSRLKDHPRSGRAGRVPGTRELVILRTPYIAVYRIKEGWIEILNLLHGAQQWPPVGEDSD